MMMTAAAIRESGRGDGSGGGITMIRGKFVMIMVVVAGVMAAAAWWKWRTYQWWWQ